MMTMKALSLTVICNALWLSASFLPPISHSKTIGNSFLAPNNNVPPPAQKHSASAEDGSSSSTTTSDTQPAVEDRKNAAYVDSLLENLMTLLDKWILTGSSATKQGAYNILQQIILHARDPEQIELAKRRVQRAGLPIQLKEDEKKEQIAEPKKELGRTDDERRRQEAEQRKNWDASRTAETSNASLSTSNSRSALSRRGAGKPDLLMGQVDLGLGPQQRFANDKVALQKELEGEEYSPYDFLRNELDRTASNKVSELVATAGSESAFEGQSLGIGGLDDVLSQVKRRVWTPLAAPPRLLNELGITPVRGLLLYGKPGCGKTLLARKLGQMLSPLRYVF
jgi:SpoVK/Ycf46/Vps4 family AAA+-type ATPase